MKLDDALFGIPTCTEQRSYLSWNIGAFGESPWYSTTATNNNQQFD